MVLPPDTAVNTKSGGWIDLAAPRSAMVEIADIVWGLARICRFGAQALDFYSVAQHAVSVSRIVTAAGNPDLAMAALHHDSHEAYCCDIPSPLKRMLEPEYSKITSRVDLVIADRLGFEPLEPGSDDAALVKEADRAAFAIEAPALLPGWNTDPPVVDAVVMDAARAEIMPLECWGQEQARRELTEAHERHQATNR